MFEKLKIFEDNNGHLIQILNFLDVNVTLKRNKDIETDACYKNTNTQDYLPYDNEHSLPCRNT